MKVLFVMSLAERLGGSERVLWTILQRIDRSRFRPLVVFFEEGPFVREVSELGIPTRVVPVGRFRQAGRGVAAVTRLARLMRAERPDLVVNFIMKAQLYAAPAALLAGMRRRVVWWQHDLPGRQPMDRLATLLPAKAVIASSEATAAAQGRLWPRRASHAILPGIAEPRTVGAGDVAALRARLGIPEGRVVVGIVGRLQEWKGQHRLLEAIARLRRSGHDVHGLFVGGTAHGVSPGYEPFLRRRTSELDLDGAVTFAGQVADAAPYLHGMDVFVSASDPEPFGLVLLEAMAVGVPIVAVGRGGPREIVGERAGILVPTGAPGDLAAGIERLLSDPELRRRLAERGRERYRARFTVERMMADFEARLAELGTA